MAFLPRVNPDMPPLLLMHRLGFPVTIAILCGIVPRAWSASPADSTREELNHLARRLEARQHAEVEREAAPLMLKLEAAGDTSSLVFAEAADIVLRARLELRAARDSQTLAWASRAFRIRSDRLGASDRLTLRSRTRVAEVLLAHGRFEQARLEASAVLAAQEAGFGRDDLDLVRPLGVIGQVGIMTGEPAAARGPLERVDSLLERAAASDSALIAGNALNLAWALNQLGNYLGARQQFERSLAIWERIEGPRGVRVAAVLHGLGGVVRRIGDHALAIPMYERSRAIWIERLGPTHPNVASSYNDQGNLHLETGAYVAADSFYSKAFAIWDPQLPPVHPNRARLFDNQGQTALRVQQPSRARALYERALEQWREIAGPASLELAHVRENLAEAHHALGNFVAARQCYLEALAGRTLATGPDHPAVATLLVGFARMLSDAGHGAAAFDTALIAERIAREHLVRTIRGLSEREGLRYASTRAVGLDVAITLLESGTARANSVAAAWDELIRSRTVVLDEIATRHRLAHIAPDSTVVRLGVELAEARRSLARMLVESAGKQPDSGMRESLERERVRCERLEQQLGARSRAFGQESARGRAGLAEVQAALPDSVALVSYLRYRHHAQRSDTTHLHRTESRYAAFVLESRTSKPRFVTLGQAEAVDSLLLLWRERVGTPGPGGSTAYLPIARAVRKALLDPLALSASHRVLIVPDGALHLVNFGTLVTDAGEYLAESGPVFQPITAERDLLGGVGERATGRGFLVAGGVDFDRADSNPLRSTATTAMPEVHRGARPECSSFASARYSPLPQSLLETRAVARRWHQMRNGEAAVELVRDRATETAFKQLAPGREMLHVATHGFFLGAACARGGARGGPSLEEREVAAVELEEPNPLLRGGVVFAGANRRERTDEGDDGILTAEEIATLDLSGVRCVLLSACDTGLGDVLAGEGLFGLRRSFQIAGARTSITSLWRVADRDARLWMDAFYDTYLRGSQDVAAAAREASRRQIEERRRRGLDPHPATWGAFASVGFD